MAAAAAALASGTGIAASNNCKLAKLAEWPVRLERNQVLVDAEVNGQKIGVLLDTGSERSLILRPAAVRLGLGLQEVKGIRIFGIGGETNVEAARIDEFRMGEAVRRNWVVIAAGERDIGADTTMILGEDFFSEVDVEFDLGHKAVRLFAPRDCGGVPLAYWATSGAGDVEIDNSATSRYRILLTVQINGRPVEALLDSGAGASMLDKAEAARLGVTTETPGVVATGRGGGLGANVVAFWTGQFASFAIGNETIKDTTIHFADLWKGVPKNLHSQHYALPIALPGMLLGVDFLRSHRVLISNSQHRMYFTYEGGPVFSVPATSGETDDDDNDAPTPDRTGDPGTGK